MVMTVLLAAGGTGGHVFPALALADTLHARGVNVLFATDTRGVKYVKDRPWLNVNVIRAGTIRKQPVALIRDMFNVVVGLLQSFDIIRSHDPDVVVGFGGYPCFPPVCAAQILSIPTLLHEQNAVIGKANASLAKLCTKLALSFPDFTGLSDKQQARTIVTGNPVRPEIAALSALPYIPRDPFNILVVGGSQGAQVFGTVIPAALRMMPAALRSRLFLRQQVRADDIEAVRKTYAELGINCEIAPFFTDMVGAWRDAHLFIGRSGASTVAEATAAGKPAIYVPYPHHKDMQQLKNAQTVTRAGGAWVMEERDFTPEWLLAQLHGFMQNPDSLSQMAAVSRSCGHPQAADALADAVLALAATKK